MKYLRLARILTVVTVKKFSEDIVIILEPYSQDHRKEVRLIDKMKKSARLQRRIVVDSEFGNFPLVPASGCAVTHVGQLIFPLVSTTHCALLRTELFI
jgi:hypothetical protein